MIIGIPIGIWAAERQENKSQLEKAKKVFDVISIEIMDNSRVISQWLATQEAKNLNTIWMLFSYLKDEAWRALSDGGDLAQLNNPLMIKDLSESYAYVHALKLMSQRYFDVLYLSGPGRAGYFGTDNDDEMYDGILKLAKEADQYSNIFTLKISTGYYGVNWGKAISEPDPD